MTRASNEKEFPGLSVNAGGRGSWLHNPDRCEIDYVKTDQGALVVKCSAGGFDRGVSITISLSFDLIVKNLPDIFSSYIEEKSRQLEFEREVAEANLNTCSETWLPIDIDLLPLQPAQKQVLREYKINTVNDLCSTTAKDLIGLPGLGESSVSKIKNWLLLRNLHLK